MNVGEKIKVYLEEENLTQTWLAYKTHIKLSKLNLTLSGKRKLTFKEYENICWALGVGVNKFLKPNHPQEVI